MRKKSKIRVIKDKININSYTFIRDLNSTSTQISALHLNSMGTRENAGVTEVDNLDNIYKKKKVLTNDVIKMSKDLKFSNPSQRNHSSVYE